ncbi:hypothetical protein NCCP691_05990 [Noviherbaspirillum aridicola]|uniref:Uncharacterized protein n=2 Tax=Noviherbaspirillum aridicola TaxID=2849687 RepID=A0ABQ4Q180_9BURK|nr:hypothetical protein NCCP691_05990 [Noviherbaspirillum aridicola]
MLRGRLPTASEDLAAGPTRPAAVHIHTMWYVPPSREPRRPWLNDIQSRRRLIEAYLGLRHGTRDIPGNADVHLWTDRHSIYPLLMPLTLPSGAELELPHSMLARDRIKLHYQGELDALIAQIPDETLRRRLSALLHHPIGQNIGALTDIVRLIYGLLYSQSPLEIKRADWKDNFLRAMEKLAAPLNARLRKHQSVDEDPGQEINIHIDFDTLAATAYYKAAEQLGLGVLPKDLLHESWAQFAMARLACRYMAASLHEQRTVQADAASVYSAEAARAVDSDAITAVPPPRLPQPKAAAVAIENTSGTMRIPRNMVKRGINPYGMEIDVLAIVPGHPRAISVSAKMLHGLQTGHYRPGISPNEVGHALTSYAGYKSFARNIAYKMRKLDAKPAGMFRGVPDHATTVDYYRLAERIRQLEPKLQDEVHLALAIAGNAEFDDETRSLSRKRAAALAEIFKWSTDLIDAMVNRTTYFPQVANAPRRNEKLNEVMAFEKSVFGTAPVSLRAGSAWGKARLNTGDEPLEPPSDALLKEIFREVKTMLPASDTSTLEYAL